MKIDFSNNCIALDKELNPLDELALGFSSIFNGLGIKSVFISGYVSILFGRNRASEDVDVFIEEISESKFKQFWESASANFECLQCSDSDSAYNDYLNDSLALRFSQKGGLIPNIEVKFPKTDIDEWTLENRRQVKLNGKNLFISPLEVQIPYKLFLGSEKDIEDAKYLYSVFKNNLDLKELMGFNKRLGAEKAFEEHIL